MAGAYPIGSIAGLIRIQGAAQAQRDILGVQRSMTLTGDSAGKAASGIGRTEKAFAGAGREAGSASSGTAKFRAAQLSAVAASERYNAVLADQNATLRQLATAEAGVIRANERMKASAIGATAPIRGMATQTEESAGAMSRAGVAMGGFVKTAAGLGLALGGFELVKKAIDIGKEASHFQADMVKIQTQAGASAAEIHQFSGEVLDLAGPTAQAPEDLATSLYHVYSATKTLGYTGPQMMNAVKVAAEGATASGSDLEETTNALTATMVSGLGSVNNMGAAMGQLNAIVGAGDMKLADLNDALGTGILAAAKAFGLSLNQVGAALDVFGDNNIRGADAATKLRQVFQDLSKPAASAAKVLSQVGLSTTDLRDDLEKGGLSLALHHLKSSLNDAGITGNKVGGFIEDAFTKKAGVGLAILLNNLEQYDEKQKQIAKSANSFGAVWTATTQTAAFAFKSLGTQAEAAGIRLEQRLLPAGAAVAGMIAHALPAALTVAGNALHPFVAGWEAVAPVLTVVGRGLSDVAHFLAPVTPGLEKVGSAALGVWVAFKGYQIARYATQALIDYFATVQAKAAAGLTNIRNYGSGVVGTLSGNATQSQLTSAIMQAEFAKIEAAAADEAAAIDRAAAVEAEAFATMVAASDDATATMIANSANTARAAQTQAEASELAAATTATAAETAAADVTVAGETASIGWAGVLGPLAAVGLGIGLLISMFHKSDTASKEAAAAAKAYTDALKGGDGGGDTILGAVVQQLKDNNVPGLLDDLNKALGRSTFNAGQFATAIEAGGKPLDQLRGHLEAIIKTGTTWQAQKVGDRFSKSVQVMTPAAQAATKALAHLNTQYSSLTKAAQKELLDAKSLGVVATSVDEVTGSLNKGSTQTQISTDLGRKYAAMLGFVADKNGIAAGSTEDVTGAIRTVAAAFNTATQTGGDFLAALDTFSKSGANAEDRAKLIGATLVAANGDALNFAAAMNTAAQADKQLVTDLASAAKGKSSIGTLIDSFVNLKTGVIDYNKTAAAPLISGLQSMQDAAMKAAEAEFQHARSYTNGKNAADAAYKVYVNQTRGALIDQAKQLGISTTQAGKLADQYFGMPKNVKTLIEQEGANPLVDILNKIGQQLSYLTGHPWTPTVDADTSPLHAKLKDAQSTLDNVHQRKGIFLHLDPGDVQQVTSMAQAHIDSLLQKHKPGIDVDPTDALHRLADAQTTLNSFRQFHKPLIDADPTDALHHIADAQNTIDYLRQKHRPVVDIDANDALHHLADIRNGLYYLHDKDIYVNVHQRVLGTPIPKASGGYISGPGSGTSDSIPARLSNGEYVVKASAVAQHRPLLDAINYGRGFAAGGPVSSSAPASLGVDLSPLTSRLDAIERAVLGNPDRLAAVGADLYERAGQSSARATQRLVRKG